MEHAKDTAKIMSNIIESTERRDPLDAKPEINNLLHMYLPDGLTMKESEVLAMVIQDIICNPKDYITTPNSL